MCLLASTNHPGASVPWIHEVLDVRPYSMADGSPSPIVLTLTGLLQMPPKMDSKESVSVSMIHGGTIGLVSNVTNSWTGAAGWLPQLVRDAFYSRGVGLRVWSKSEARKLDDAQVRIHPGGFRDSLDSMSEDSLLFVHQQEDRDGSRSATWGIAGVGPTDPFAVEPLVTDDQADRLREIANFRMIAQLQGGGFACRDHGERDIPFTGFKISGFEPGPDYYIFGVSFLTDYTVRKTSTGCAFDIVGGREAHRTFASELKALKEAVRSGNGQTSGSGVRTVEELRILLESFDPDSGASRPASYEISVMTGPAFRASYLPMAGTELRFISDFRTSLGDAENEGGGERDAALIYPGRSNLDYQVHVRVEQCYATDEKPPALEEMAAFL